MIAPLIRHNNHGWQVVWDSGKRYVSVFLSPIGEKEIWTRERPLPPLPIVDPNNADLSSLVSWVLETGSPAMNDEALTDRLSGTTP